MNTDIELVDMGIEFNFEELDNIIALVERNKEIAEQIEKNIRQRRRDDAIKSNKYSDLKSARTILDAESPDKISEKAKKYINNNVMHLYIKYGIKYIADLILRIAKYYTPVDTGNLRDSGRYIYDNDNNSAKIIFGEGLDYAVYVHEILDNYHRIGRAKFLEDAAYQVLNSSLVDEPIFKFEMTIENKVVICNITSNIDRKPVSNDDDNKDDEEKRIVNFKKTMSGIADALNQVQEVIEIFSPLIKRVL